MTAPTTAPRTIRVRYRSCDGYSKSGSWKTVKGASRFARKWVGDTPERGTFYAVSADGIGRVTWEGATFGELFPAAESPTESWRTDLEAEANEPEPGRRYDAPYTEEDAMRDEDMARYDDNRERYAAEVADLDAMDAADAEDSRHGDRCAYLVAGADCDCTVSGVAKDPSGVWYPNGNPAEMDGDVPF